MAGALAMEGSGAEVAAAMALALATGSSSIVSDCGLIDGPIPGTFVVFKRGVEKKSVPCPTLSSG